VVAKQCVIGNVTGTKDLTIMRRIPIRLDGDLRIIDAWRAYAE
jgi:hypothetical protein